MTHRPWKNGEYHYITELMRTRGNSNVPQAAVLSYLDLQANDTAQSNEPEIAKLIRKAHTILAIDNLSPDAFDKAFKLLMAPSFTAFYK